MKDFEVKYEGNHIVAYNKLLFETFPLSLFDQADAQNSALLDEKPTANSLGRGAVQFFTYQDVDLVLRHYHRGGLPAKISNDHYIWSGLEQTRAIQEIDLLAKLQLKQLPVPVPAAAHIHRSGLKYQADIVTVCIPNAQTLGELISVGSLNEQEWQAVGQTIKQFHKNNCNHADLNVNNILFDENKKMYLIDFDRSKIMSSAGVWQEKNLQRLRRSLDKLVNANSEINFTDENFSSLTLGYQSA